MSRHVGLVLAVSLCFGVDVALAQCTCTYHSETAETAYDAAAVVFVGTVADVVEIERVLTVTVEVSEVWKGRPGQRLVIREDKCIVNYQVGEPYLVYGWEGQDGMIWAGACTRSRELRRAGEDIEAFRGAGRSRG